MIRAFPLLRSRLLALAVLSLLVVISVLVVRNDAPAVAQSASVTVSPTSMTVPVGSRKCYNITTSTQPTHGIRLEVGNSDYSKATVTPYDNSDWKITGDAMNWKVPTVNCVKGVAVGTATISHSMTSDDTNYNGISISSVAVTVTAADTKSTVRFLHSEIRAIEGDYPANAYRGGSGPLARWQYHSLKPLRAVTVKLDIAPAPSSNGDLLFHQPHGDCGRDVSCTWDHEGTASYDGDYVAEGLHARHVPYTSGSNDAEFTFYIRSDDYDEPDEWTRVFIKSPYTSDLCIGTCNNAGKLQQSMKFTIIDDDGSDNDMTQTNCPYCQIGGEEGSVFVGTDDAGVTVSAANPLSVSEGSTATYTVVLDSEPTADVTITPRSADTGAVTVSPASHTFTSSNWSTAATFTVSGVSDADTRDETVGISHSVTSKDASYKSVVVNTVRVSVSDTTQLQTHNRAPTVVQSPADVTIASESGAETVFLFSTVDDSPVSMFADADGDDLTVTAASSDESVATVSLYLLRATVTAKSRGTATITVTANDGRGGTVSDEFTVTVKAAPTVASSLSDISDLEAGTTRDVSLSGVFTDPDGDALTITAGSDDSIATVSVASDGSKLTVAGVSAGDATIIVVAQDSDGNQVGDSFDVAVTASQPVLLRPPTQQDSQQQQQVPTNRAPTVASQLADISGLAEGATRDISLSGVFSDADGDALTITASSDYETVATATVSSDHSTLTLAADSSGVATITVVAQDPDGNRATLSFDVEVTDQQPVEQQPPAQQSESQQQEDTPTSEPETTPTPEPEAETGTQESGASDAVARYDTNGDGTIDLSEYSQAANDYFDGKITHSEMEEVALAYRVSSG